MEYKIIDLTRLRKPMVFFLSKLKEKGTINLINGQSGWWCTKSRFQRQSILYPLATVTILGPAFDSYQENTSLYIKYKFYVKYNHETKKQAC